MSAKFISLLSSSHYPVLHSQLLTILSKHLNNPILGGDLTVGCGGHSRLLLELFPALKLICLDIDSEVLPVARTTLAPFIDRVSIIHKSYTKIGEINVNTCFPTLTSSTKFDFMLLDLGFNSLHVDSAERGFTYLNDEAVLDMRYDRKDTSKMTAADWLNDSTPLELNELFKMYASESHYETLTDAILKYRESNKIRTAGEFNQIIGKSVKDGYDYKTRSRIYGALRMAVNSESLNIQTFLQTCAKRMRNDGVLAVITFNKVEDELVRYVLGIMDKRGYGKLGKVLKPTKEEVEENSRSAPAKLRFIKFNL